MLVNQYRFVPDHYFYTVPVSSVGMFSNANLHQSVTFGQKYSATRSPIPKGKAWGNYISIESTAVLYHDYERVNA